MSIAGSPPRVREKQFGQGIPCGYFGITPACAGKTCGSQHNHAVYWDHPRVCGKNVEDKSEKEPNAGSPPRVREKPDIVSRSFKFTRITPACAGKTQEISLHHRKCWDHPRVCGKNLTYSSRIYSRLGSPPRVREKPRRTL